MGKPELRFPEFTEEWEEVILKDVLKRVSIPVDVDKETSYKQIGIRSHGKGLFYKESVTGKELGNKRVFWIEPDCLVLNIVFAWERAVARTTQNEVGLIASHRFPMYKTADNKLDLDYAVQYLTTKKGSNILILASPGGAGRNKTLGQDAFLKSRMLLPNIAEQKKIVELLQAINDVITIEQNQVLLWEEKKKCVMQMIFSQEIKFKADNGSDYPEWEYKIIRDCLQYEQPTKYLVSSEDYNANFKTPVLTANKGFILGYTNEEEGIYDKGNAIIYDDFTMDTKYVTFKFKVKSSAIKILTSKDDIDLYYVFSYIQSLNLHQAEHARSYISKVESMDIPVPCADEQLKITECLSTIDNVINMKHQKVDVWENIRNGLLQQMFI